MKITSTAVAILAAALLLTGCADESDTETVCSNGQPVFYNEVDDTYHCGSESGPVEIDIDIKAHKHKTSKTPAPKQTPAKTGKSTTTTKR